MHRVMSARRQPDKTAGSFEKARMDMRGLLLALLIAMYSGLSPGRAQQVEGGADDVQKGHYLALVICSSCHVAAPDQLFEPMLEPPAPSFDTISRRRNTTVRTLRTFLATTHRNIRNAAGMPNPDLVDFQVRQLTAYILSLRAPSAAPGALSPSAAQPGSCRVSIARIELLLKQAHTSGQPAASGPESRAARLHHQPTTQSVEQAESEAEKDTETALAFARRLEAKGLEAECAAMLQNVELSLGLR
jgi:mono/diheme cytochrome c family protein